MMNGDMCPSGKIAYPSKNAAWLTLKNMGAGITYQCPMCKMWHVGADKERGMKMKRSAGGFFKPPKKRRPRRDPR